MTTERNIHILEQVNAGVPVPVVAEKYGISEDWVKCVMYQTKAHLSEMKKEELYRFLWERNPDGKNNERYYNAFRRNNINTVRAVAGLDPSDHIRCIGADALAKLISDAKKEVEKQDLLCVNTNQ